MMTDEPQKVSHRVAGVIVFQINGEIHQAAGDFTYCVGFWKRKPLAGVRVVHGYSESWQPPSIEGVIRDRKGLDLKILFSMDNATVTIRLGNGKAFALTGAFYAGDGLAHTEDATVDVRFGGTDGEEYYIEKEALPSGRLSGASTIFRGPVTS